MLHDPQRHEPLTENAWSDAAAAAAIESIVADTSKGFDVGRLWPTHPLDEPKDDEAFCMLYFGAAGVIWALRRLRDRGVAVALPEFRQTVAGLLERNRLRTRKWESEVPSLLMGDTGILLLQWQFAPSVAGADAIHRAVEGNLRNPTLEQLWGSAGTLPAAIHMYERTGERRWADLLETGAGILREQVEEVPGTGISIWTQDLYGRRVRYLGGGHGFAGNVFPVFRGAHMLPAALVADFARLTARTLIATALREGELANWPGTVPFAGENPDRRLVQDCHGAPGILCRLPRHGVPEVDLLLAAAGELIWQAGPLSKGAGLCHGTAGNGYALLRLYRRTGNRLWLDRARAFAMHAIGQCAALAARHGQRRYSLWTGDPGVALFVQSCRMGDDDFPTLDVF